MSSAPAAAAKKKADTAEPLRPVAPLPRDRWKARESGVHWNEHEVVPEAGTPFETLLRAEYWSNVAMRFKPGDNIIAFVEDGAWRAELIVWNVGQNWAQVAVREPFAKRPDLGAAPGAAAEAFAVEWAGPIKKHRVIRIADRAELKTGFVTPEDANRWLTDHRRAMRN